MASALIGELTKKFSLDGVDIDNWTFKFYSRVTFGVFMMAAAASTASSYGGDAIKCMSGTSYDESYCWLHGTSHLPLKPQFSPGRITNTIRETLMFILDIENSIRVTFA